MSQELPPWVWVGKFQILRAIRLLHCYGSICLAWNWFPKQPASQLAFLIPFLSLPFPSSFHFLLLFISFVQIFAVNSLLSPAFISDFPHCCSSASAWGGSYSTNNVWSLDSGSTFSSSHTLWFPLCIQVLQNKLLKRKARVAKGWTLHFCLQIHCLKKYQFAATRGGWHSALLRRTVWLSPSSFGFTWREE